MDASAVSTTFNTNLINGIATFGGKSIALAGIANVVGSATATNNIHGNFSNNTFVGGLGSNTFETQLGEGSIIAE